MSTTRLRETEAVRERERILSTPLRRKPSDLSLEDSPTSDLSLISPPGPVLVKQTPVHHYNRTLQQQPGPQGPKFSSTPFSWSDSGFSGSSSNSSESPGRNKRISSSPALLGSGHVEEVKVILDFQKRLDVIEGQEEVDSGFESLIQNEDEERNVEVKLNEDSPAGQDSNLGDPVVISASELKPSLGAVAKRTSPRNKQKPSTDRLGKPASKHGRSKPNLTVVAQNSSREGQEVVDFIRHLPGVALEILLSYLSGRDLCRVVRVSTSWRSALVKVESSHNERRLAYISDMKRERENLGKENLFLDRRISPRRAMVDIFNRISPSTKRDRNHSASILVSPSKACKASKSLHVMFREEGKKLSDGERLVKCPACSSPSRVSTILVSPDSRPAVNQQKEKARCSSSQCNLVFCPECQCPDHPDRPCRARRSAYKLSKGGGVTSQKSKNRLRRL